MIKILRLGSQLCIVDRGRHGYRRYGVPTGGAMDQHSALVANTLVGNHPDAALLELYQAGHRLHFMQDATVVLAGANADVSTDDRPIPIHQVFKMHAGETLSVGTFIQGVRIYLAIAGGIKTTPLLGSRSLLSGVSGDRIRIGDILPFDSVSSGSKGHGHVSPMPISSHNTISATPGPEWHRLTAAAQRQLLNTTYYITEQSDRMGYRLAGTALKGKYPGIMTSAVLPGTVQLLPSGLPIILMRDCQTTGGYLRILQILPEDINQLAQRPINGSVVFEIQDW